MPPGRITPVPAKWLGKDVASKEAAQPGDASGVVISSKAVWGQRLQVGAHTPRMDSPEYLTVTLEPLFPSKSVAKSERVETDGHSIERPKSPGLALFRIDVTLFTLELTVQ